MSRGDRRDSGQTDRVGSVEVGLSDTEREDVLAFGLQLGHFTQHDFQRWGRLWWWRLGEIAAKRGDRRNDVELLLGGLEEVGETGFAESDLRPSGIARFGERRESVVSRGEFISSGAWVEVVEIEGTRLVVEEKESFEDG